MNSLLKRTGLYFLYNILAFLVGMLIGSGAGLALRLAFQTNMVSANLINGSSATVFSAVALFFLMHRDAYEKRQFSGKSLVLSAVSVCVIRWLLFVLSNGKLGFWVSGSATLFTPVLFPDTEVLWYHLLCLVACDLLIIFPTFLLGAYSGYKRKRNEIESLQKTHQ